MNDIITIRDFILIILRKNKLIAKNILVIAILSVLMTASYYVFVDKEDIEKQTEHKETVVASIENKERSIEKTQQNLQSSNEYINKSLLMNLDGFSIHSRRLIFSVDTSYKIMPDVAYQNPDITRKVVSLYEEIIYGKIFIEMVEKEMNLNKENRIIDLFQTAKSATNIGKAEDGLIYIDIIGGNEESTKQLADITEQYIIRQHTDIISLTGPHTLEVVGRTYAVKTDTNVLSQQKERNREVVEFSNSYELQKKELDALLKEKENIYIGNRNPKKILMKSMKAGLLGAAVGMGISVFWIFFINLFDDKIYSEEELIKGYSIPIIGRYKGDKSV